MKVAIILKAPSLDNVVTEEKVIFADAGYKFKNIIGDKEVLAVVGDFDSLKAPPKDEVILSLNVEKDYTDGERAVILAKEMGATEIVIYGAVGGNIDHVLGNLALLKIAKNLCLKAMIKDGDSIIKLISENNLIKVEKGKKLSLIPYGGNCKFKRSSGLYYPLDGITLTPADTRGISNQTLLDSVEIDLEHGEALVIYKN